MKLSNKGILEIAEHEGIVPAPYLDSVGVWTFGVGHTVSAGDPDPATMHRGIPKKVDAVIDEALQLFKADVVKYESRVNKAIKVQIKQHEFDALVSFDFNTGGIYRAELTKAINEGRSDASRHFMGWLKPKEIIKRRKAEKHLFETGDYDANGDTIPVWRVDSKGKLKGISHTVSGAELLRRMGVSDDPKSNPDWSWLIAALLRMFGVKK